MRNKWIVSISLLIGFILSFGWGAAAIKFQIFPYKLIRQAVVPPGASPAQIAAAGLMEKYPREADVVFIGDSIFSMVQWQDVFPNIRVVERAIGNDTSKNILDRVRSIQATRAPAAVMLVGANDVNNGVPEAETVANIAAIRRALPGELYILSVLPCSYANPGCAEKSKRIKSLNNKLREIPGIRFVDVAAGMSADDIGDGTHPNLAGLEKIVASVKDVLSARPILTPRGALRADRAAASPRQ
ncbi:hypothetical protein EIK56_18205 [Sphingomonas sp. C8-2]|nr:hypothetical protein EIK56_18205 [Sphingomonas sp. C8-2]